MYNISGEIITHAREYGNKIDAIPPGTYTVEFDPIQGMFYLLASPGFTKPSKVYGEIDTRSSKVINTFYEREGKNTGVLLSGTKGSGKTQLAKDISIQLLSMGVPTIIIQNCYTNGGFINFIKGIADRALILFDEFEKVYAEKEDQEAILTLLDGVGSYNKLYILTSNNRNVSEFLRNRPSRIFYHFEYKKLSKEVMLDLLQDKLINKTHIPQFEKLWEMSETISFDSIQCLVEELNRYPRQTFTETFHEVNVEVEVRNDGSFALEELVIAGRKMRFDEEYFNSFAVFSYVAGYDDLKAFIFLNDDDMSDVMKTIGARVYDYTKLKANDPELLGSSIIDYDEDAEDDEEEPSTGSEATVTRYEYCLTLPFNKDDTEANNQTIIMSRNINGVLVEGKWVRKQEPDAYMTMFDGK